MQHNDITFWGVIASPYQLKMQAIADHAQLSWQRCPDQAGFLEAISTALRLRRAQAAHAIQRFPQRVEGLDEYPEVPYYSLDGKRFFYDSSGLAYHLDQLGKSRLPLLPEHPEQRFICQLIDEAFDEFGLYMVHHNRWVVSAATNCMGEVTSQEMRKVLLWRRKHMAQALPRRQVRRCPYLFSVASPDIDVGLAKKLTPPARQGFPPTHALLDSAWRKYLSAMEGLLAQQPFILGDRFTLADASAYGQLSMNLIDGTAAEVLEELAPLTFRWLCNIRDGGHRGSSGELYLSEHLSPLLEIISDTFTPLMQQNFRAYQAEIDRGQTLFNEAAFDKGEALYNGELLGMPFRSVVKSFQVPVWQNICEAWVKLSNDQRQNLHSQNKALTDENFTLNPPE
ncbi:MAG: glutathione S-transferase C-terminal domain-containing protein [Halioglobus sp.]